MKIWKWIKNLFRRHSDDTQVTIPPVQPIPEIPTREEVESFPPKKLVQVFDDVNDGKPSKPDWTYLITTAKIDPEHRKEVFDLVKQQVKYWDRYKELERRTSVPAGVVANIHLKESSLDFNRCLHNGDRVIGNGKKTWQVPKGRGPFETWEEAAIDALMMKKNIFPAEWTTVNTLIFCQRYNGLGHQNKGLEYSPYIWAYTSHHDETGNYIADGKYSSTAAIKSPGIMALMLVQEELALL